MINRDGDTPTYALLIRCLRDKVAVLAIIVSGLFLKGCACAPPTDFRIQPSPGTGDFGTSKMESVRWRAIAENMISQFNELQKKHSELEPVINVLNERMLRANVLFSSKRYGAAGSAYKELLTKYGDLLLEYGGVLPLHGPIIEQSLLSLQRVLVCTDELAVLSTGKTTSSVIKDFVTDKLAALSFKVVQSSKQLSFSPSEREQDAFRESAKCNLALVVTATVQKAEKFGDFWSFTGDARGKVLNLTTHQIIASKHFTKRGKRGLNEAQAARSALEAVSKDLVTYLTDEVVRQWEVTSLVRMTLVATNMDNAEMAYDLRVGLQKRVGIYYVSLDSWDSKSQVAVYEILCRYDVQRFLTSYVAELRKGKVKIKSIRRSGKVIKMKRKYVP